MRAQHQQQSRDIYDGDRALTYDVRHGLPPSVLLLRLAGGGLVVIGEVLLYHLVIAISSIFLGDGDGDGDGVRLPVLGLPAVGLHGRARRPAGWLI